MLEIEIDGKKAQVPDGSTVMDASQEAPGFTPDPDAPGCGTWWCPACGDGKPAGA